MAATSIRASQLSPHRATRADLSGPYGPVAALVAGPPAAAATVLLVPGYTGSKEDFAPLLDPIVDAGLAVATIDLPGQHESPGPADEPSYLPARLGTVVAELVRGLAPQPVILLGHSYGGLVARAAAVELAGGGYRLAGLVLMCVGPAALPDGDRRRMLDAAEPVLRAHGLAVLQAVREALEANSAPPGTPPPTPEVAAFLRARFLGSTEAGLLGMADGVRSEPDRVDELGAALVASGVPCLVACGELDDAWTPRSQRETARRLGVPFALIPDSAHCPNTENPAALLDVLLPAWRGWLGNRPSG